MASAYEQLQGQTSGEPVSFYDFYNAYGAAHSSTDWMNSDPYSLGSSFQNFFKGTRDSAEVEYNNYLKRLESAKTFEREDTAIQRQVADIMKAGLNPWLALNGGSFPAQPTSAAASYRDSRSKNDEQKSASSLLGSALKILALLAIKG